VFVIEPEELERMVRMTFPQKRWFSVDGELGCSARSRPLCAYVHGGCDPFLERQFEDCWRVRRRSSRPTAAQSPVPRGPAQAGDYAVRPRR